MEKYEVERRFAKRGRPPDAAWAALDGLVVLVGVSHSPCIQGTLVGLAQPPPLRLPFCDLTAQGKARLFGPSPTLGITVLVLGEWPTYEEARAVANAINTRPGMKPEEWVRNVRRVAKQQPSRIVGPDFELSRSRVEMIVEAFLAECRRVVQS